ncbi:MAG: hypothetical protein ACR2NP_14170, partial [Pirellulaceae bacterium]
MKLSPHNSAWIRFCRVILLQLMLFGMAVSAGASGPENVALVVNADSPSSLLMANHYVALRKIPASNVIYLDGIPDQEQINLTRFRNEILGPVLEQMDDRGITPQIDYIVYSSGFPTQIHMPDMLERFLAEGESSGQTINDQVRAAFTGFSSTTSLTYFARQVMNDDPSFMLLDSNWYMRRKDPSGEYLPTRSFHSSDVWTNAGTLTDDRRRGRSYFISTMLGVTRDEGLSESDNLAFLQRSVAADGIPPA